MPHLSGKLWLVFLGFSLGDRFCDVFLVKQGSAVDGLAGTRD
jgi:hypothetical protein